MTETTPRAASFVEHLIKLVTFIDCINHIDSCVLTEMLQCLNFIFSINQPNVLHLSYHEKDDSVVMISWPCYST